MSVPAAATHEALPTPAKRSRLPRYWVVLALLGAVLALSVLRIVTGADDLVSTGTVAATLIIAAFGSTLPLAAVVAAMAVPTALLVAYSVFELQNVSPNEG